jgi:hypothetical protein
MKGKFLLITLLIFLISIGFSTNKSCLIGTIGYQYSNGNGLALVSFSPYIRLENFIFKLTFPAYIGSDFSLKSFTKWDDTIDYVGYEDSNSELAITSKKGYFRDFFDTSAYEYSEEKYIFVKTGDLIILKGLYGIDSKDEYASMAMNFSPVLLYLDYNNGDLGITGTYSLKPLFLSANYYTDGSASLGGAINFGNLSLVGKYYYKRKNMKFGLSTISNPNLLFAINFKDVGMAVSNTGNYLIYLNSSVGNFSVDGIYQKDGYDLDLSYKTQYFKFYTHLKNNLIEIGVRILLL